MVGNSSDNQIIVPVNFARNLVNLRSDNVDPYFMVKASPGISTVELRDDIRGDIRSIRKLKPREEDDFALNETSLLSNSLKDMFHVLTIVGWILGGLSILVGGFSIANIMFVSVRERTSIIGVKNHWVQKLFYPPSIPLLKQLCFAFSEEWSDFFSYGYLLRLPALLLISISRWLWKHHHGIDDLRRDWNYQRNHSCHREPLRWIR